MAISGWGRLLLACRRPWRKQWPYPPNLNVYRRFKPDEFVPVTTAWGENNRSMAFRVRPSDPANRRIEHRVSGAEANPYLVAAAVLAGVHHGLAQALDPGAK
jgi:glutamine synthetase